jgi:hypothetical protein
MIKTPELKEDFIKLQELNQKDTFICKGKYYIVVKKEPEQIRAFDIKNAVEEMFLTDDLVKQTDFYLTDTQKEKTNKIKKGPEEKNNNKIPGKKIKTKEVELLEEFLNKSCKLKRFPKTAELNNDENVHDYRIYVNNYGGLSNIIDKLGYKYKNDKLTKNMKTSIDKMCEECNEDKCEDGPWACLVRNTNKDSSRAGRLFKNKKKG